MSNLMILGGCVAFVAVFASLMYFAPDLEGFLAKRRNKLQLVEVIALLLSILFLIDELKNSADLLEIANREALTKNILHIEDSERFINNMLIEEVDLLNALFQPDKKNSNESDSEKLSKEESDAITLRNKEKMLAFILLHDWQKYYRLCHAGAMQTERWVSVLSLMNNSLGAPDSHRLLREQWNQMLNKGSDQGFHPGFTSFFKSFAKAETLSEGFQVARDDRWLTKGKGCLNSKNLDKFSRDYKGYADTLKIDVVAN